MNESLKLIRQLAEDVKQQESAFLSPSYQESEVRQDFIDKFFTSLGWDVTHEQEKNPYEQEVKIENKATDAEVSRLEMQCASLDRQIDAGVYELYGLTEEEIAIVEDSTRRVEGREKS